MMNSDPNNYFIFRQRIDQSTTIEEVVGLIREIDTLRASEETASDAYDLLAVAFQALANLTHENITEGERLIFDYLLPYLFYENDASVRILSDIHRLRECLIDWYDQYPEPESIALRGRILDQLLLKLQSMPSSSACWIISDIGYRRQDIMHELWIIVEQYDNDLGDTALATLTALGVPNSEKGRLLAALHERVPKRTTLPLIAALRRLADASSLSPVLQAWLQNDTEQPDTAHRSLALRILIDIADHSNLEEIQDQVWQAVIDLYQRQPEKFAFDIFLGGDIAPRCDSTRVVPTLLQWIDSEQGDSEAAANHRRLLNLRLEDCLRPRQLEGWRIEPDPSTISVLRQDACLDTRFEGRATTHEMLIKEAAWQTLMCIGDGQILNWFKDAVSGETNRYLRGKICDLFACFRLDPLPADVIHWIVEPFEANLPADSAEFVARLSAIRVARSSASRESFEALLTCGLSVNGENLRELVEALEDVALALARSGDTLVVSQLVDTVVEHSESRRRSAAGSALVPLTAEGLLGKQDVERLAKTLLEQDDRDPFERSTIVAALGNLSKQEFSKELLLPFQQWARERNDWLGIQSLFALTKHDNFLQHEDLVAKVGLQHVGESRFTFPLVPHSRYAPWIPQLIGLLYTLYPEELLPAVVSIVEEFDWGSVVPIIWGVYEIHEQNAQAPLAREIVEAFVSRIQKRQGQTSAEPDIFHTLAELMPEKLVQEPWDKLWDNWLPDARTALAESLGEAVYSTSEAQAKAIALLRLLTADGQYAVRRAAYRSLANQSPTTLEILCIMWAQASSRELRQRAAEAWTWLPVDSEAGIAVHRELAVDTERSVREIVHRVWNDQRKREWAKEYLSHVRRVTGETNDEILQTGRYGQALTHVGDDVTIRLLRVHLRTRSLPSHLRYWLRQVIKDMDENWQKAVRKWPQPWRTWTGSIEEGDGWILLPDEQKLPVHYALWQERAATLSEISSWGGTIQIQDKEKLLGVSEISLHVADTRQGKALLANWERDMIAIIGQGPYPE